MVHARSGPSGLAGWLLAPLVAALLAGLAVPQLAAAAESGASETYRVSIAARLADD